MRVKSAATALRQRVRVRLRRSQSWRRLRKQLTVDLLGGFLRLNTELTLEDVDAELILTQRRRAPTLEGVEAHECSMGHFLQRIEAEQSQRGLNGWLRLVELHLVSEQLGERLEGEFVQALPLGPQPLLELG